MANIRLKPWANPFEKNRNFFKIFALLVFYSLERRFLALEYRKIHFPGLEGLK